MKIIALHKQDQNEAWLDPWSAVHAATGLAFGLIGMSGWVTLGAGIAWDIFEQIFERSKVGQKFFKTSGPESWGNIGTDLALFMGGWKLGNMYNNALPPSALALNPAKRRKGKKKRKKNPSVESYAYPAKKLTADP